MEGYGEFSWKDGKKYAGYYIHDKKEGFGIYYWEKPSRVYIGFWKAGKQNGIGKYINSKSTKFGKWKNGERESNWFKDKEEALTLLMPEEEKYKPLFEFGLNDVTKFLGS